MESLIKQKNKSLDKSFIRQAEQIWSMLDDMADSDVESYRFDQNFCDKQII